MNFIDLGLVEYQVVRAQQKAITAGVIAGAYPDTVIFCQHPDVITVGRSGGFSNILASENDLAQKNIKVIFTDRGGDVTYHGPGQLIAYPILDLRRRKKDARLYLRNLELAVINLLSNYNISGARCAGKTGVWVRDEKIASIGVGISHWVTYHGVSVNVNTDLKKFSLINPCGLKGAEMTSLEKVLSAPKDIEEVKEKFKNAFADVFGYCRAEMKGEQESEKIYLAELG